MLVGHSSGAQLVLEAVARGLPARRVVVYEPPYVMPGRTPPGADLADRLATLPPPEATVLFLTEEKLRWNHGVGFGLLLAAVFFVYHKW